MEQLSAETLTFLKETRVKYRFGVVQAEAFDRSWSVYPEPGRSTLADASMWRWGKQKLPSISWAQLQLQVPEASKIAESLVFPPDFDGITLNEEQLVAIVLVLIGFNMFLTGCAGTGKSAVVRVCIHMLRSIEFGMMLVTGTTGVSVVNIEGLTIDSAFQLHVVNPKSWQRSLESNGLKDLSVLIIDEISMLQPARLYELHNRLQYLKAQNGRRYHLPFAGVQVICTGDFSQLPPVMKEHKDAALQRSHTIEQNDWFRSSGLLCERSIIERAVYVFQVPLFWSLVQRCVQLRKVVRQSNAAFITFLANLRFGLTTQADTEHFLRTHAPPKNERELAERGDVLYLFPKNDDVHRMNAERMQLLPAPEIHSDMIQRQGVTGATFVGQLERSDQHLTLKQDCVVRFTRNWGGQRKDYFFCNGTRGVVKGFLPVCCTRVCKMTQTKTGIIMKTEDRVAAREPPAELAACIKPSLFKPKKDAELLYLAGNGFIATACQCRYQHGVCIIYVASKEDSAFGDDHPLLSNPNLSEMHYHYKPDKDTRAKNFNYSETANSSLRHYVPVIKITEGGSSKTTVVLPPAMWTSYIYINRKRIPAVSQVQSALLLNYAATIHRTQGLTLEAAYIQAPYFEEGSGLLYTALSRVRDPQNLIVSSNTAFHRSGPSREVFVFYNFCIQ